MSSQAIDLPSVTPVLIRSSGYYKLETSREMRSLVLVDPLSKPKLERQIGLHKLI